VLVDWPRHRAANLTHAVFPNRPADRVAALALAGLVDRVHHGVALFATGCLADLPADGVGLFAEGGLDHSSVASHLLLIPDSLIDRLIASDLFRLIDRFVYGLEAG